MTEQRILEAFDEFEQLSSFNVASARSTDEYCNEGQDNWKRTDPYREQCAFSETRYYGFDGDFGQTLLRLHDTLTFEGWDAPYEWTKQIPWVLEYHNPGSERNGRPFDVSMMPQLYDAYDVNGLRVEISFAERSSPLSHDPFSNVASLAVQGAIITQYYRDSDIVDYEVPIRELTETDTYVVAVKISEIYYSD